MITHQSTIISFKLTGMNTSAKVISSTVNFGTIDGKTMADLSDLRDKINGFTGDTGIQAKLSADKQTLDLRSPDGYDILIDDFDMPMETATSIPPKAEDNPQQLQRQTMVKLHLHQLTDYQMGDAIRV